MDGLLPMIGAGLAVALLVLLAARLGFRGTPRLAGADEARQIAASLPGGFRPADLVLDKELRGALLADSHGRVSLVAPFGAHFIGHELAPNTAIDRLGDQLVITVVGRKLQLDLGAAAPDWQARVTQTDRPQ